MTKEQIQVLAGMDAINAVAAFTRILAERPDERAALVRACRSELPDLYAKWLDQNMPRTGSSPLALP